MGEYLERSHAATENDGVLGTELFWVINMPDEPSWLFAPDLGERVNCEVPATASGD
ncbi:hypothetical protein GCM10010464_64800 [Pseudonocardia yunnanensis]|uniref:Uncharacterized protein n=1 Tax=Pseudonocardia yunnanensis TaxID=58107 RepID=A0ABW4F6S9_9PSEU